MKREIRIYPREINHKNYFKDQGNNVSTIVTQMIKLAGRICDHYASDIYYIINEFMHFMKNNLSFKEYIIFRELGVSPVFADDKYMFEKVSTWYSECIQVWTLEYDSETEVTTFTRGDLTIKSIDMER